MKRTEIKQLFAPEGQQLIGTDVVVKGWVRTKRGNKNVAFIALNDGSTINNIQVVVDPTSFDPEMLRRITTGACIGVQGQLVASQGAGQSVEVQARNIEIYGEADPDSYPLQKKGHSMEFLREIGHLRPRTNTFGAVCRIRHHMAYAIHTFFHERGFFYFHTPLITASDCEGAGEMFQVTTLDLKNPPRLEDGSIDYSQDFFGKQTALTVSGQLEGELGATALGKIYTFGPTFRAENSNTPRHLAEFWMIEPEMAFYDIDDLTALEEEFIKYCVTWALEHCQDDLQFLNNMIDKGLIERLNHVASSDFGRVTYTEAIEILEKHNDQFENKVYWGCDLQTEHERFLTEQEFKRPVFVTDYPKEIKAFYMKLNPDGKTVAAMDCLVPGIGEIIGGSQREEDLEKLQARMRELKMEMEGYEAYFDLRRFGTTRHAGFGLGFERCVMYLTGVANIRDVIPFPRTAGHCEG